ncbi:MAG: sugar ABC transporter permease [Acidimicrobiales bacterium]
MTIETPGTSEPSSAPPPDAAPDAAPATAPDAAPDPTVMAFAPELLASTFPEYLQAWWTRIRGGESGALPILAGLVIIVVVFQTQASSFLSAGNLVNLLVQATFFILLGTAEMFALLLSEIDLSVGFIAAVGGAIIAALVAAPYNWPWWAAVIIGVLAMSAWGAFQGILITRLHLPSFVVTLGGLLFLSGLLIYVFDVDSGSTGGVLRVSNKVLYNLVNGNITPVASWIILVVVLAAFGLMSVAGAARRRRQGLSAPPISITLLRVAVAAGAGVLLVIICNINRGALVPLRGVPWVIPFVLVVIAAWTVLLGRTRTGRYIYAIGASPEAARRAGVNVARMRTLAFALSGFTAALAGLVYESRLGSISVGFDGGGYVLYAVAAAVIGGTSLFGGRGKAIHPLLGGIVLAAVYNGLGLLGITTAGTDMAFALVLLAAVTVDSLARRRGTSAV